MSRFRRSVALFLFVWGSALLAYSGFMLLRSWSFQRAQMQSFQQSLDRLPKAALPKPSSHPRDGILGRIEIPRLGVSVMVMEGSDASVLSRAAGHIAGTGWPGQPGNIGISAHRDSFFRPLRHIRQGDVIALTTLLGKYQYRVVSTRIVSPYDVAVLASNSQQILTLVTCYPFYFVGSAPNRFIVRAERIT